MLRRDLILVQIEELGKAIAQMITNRDSGATRKNEDLIKVVYTTLKVDAPFLLSRSNEDIRSYLDGEDKEGLARMEMAAKTLIEESYLSGSKATALKAKAKEILIYVQQEDKTFSLERVAILSGL